jgi:signal peptide peptidase SppA
VLGPLVARGDWLTAVLGASEFGSVADAIGAAADDPAVRGIVLEVDSPGGEIGALFDTVDAIGAIRRRSAKPMVAVASEAALSAAYAIASAAERIYVSRTGEVGSVGVVAAHLDESGADAMAGLKWTLIHAGARKTDGNPHEPLSPRATADIQADVDHLYDELVALVAPNRGLDPDAVRATDAAIYRGERAVAAGLADGIGSVSRAIADLQAALEAKRIRAGPPVSRSAARLFQRQPRTHAMNTDDPVIDEPGTKAPIETDDLASETQVPDKPADQPAAAAAIADPVNTAAVDAAAFATKLRAEFAEIATVAAQAARLGLDIDAADAMRRGLKPDALRRTIFETLAARSEAADVVAVAPALAASGDSPIVKRARERAAAGSRT